MKNPETANFILHFKQFMRSNGEPLFLDFHTFFARFANETNAMWTSNACPGVKSGRKNTTRRKGGEGQTPNETEVVTVSHPKTVGWPDLAREQKHPACSSPRHKKGAGWNEQFHDAAVRAGGALSCL